MSFVNSLIVGFDSGHHLEIFQGISGGYQVAGPVHHYTPFNVSGGDLVSPAVLKPGEILVQVSNGEVQFFSLADPLFHGAAFPPNIIFNQAKRLATDQAGNLVTFDAMNRIVRTDLTGAQTIVGTVNAGPYSAYIHNLSVDAVGDVYLLMYAGSGWGTPGIVRILKISGATGAVLWEKYNGYQNPTNIPQGPGYLFSPIDITFGGDGLVYVTETFAWQHPPAKISRFRPDGGFVDVFFDGANSNMGIKQIMSAQMTPDKKALIACTGSEIVTFNLKGMVEAKAALSAFDARYFCWSPQAPEPLGPNVGHIAEIANIIFGVRGDNDGVAGTSGHAPGPVPGWNPHMQQAWALWRRLSDTEKEALVKRKMKDLAGLLPDVSHATILRFLEERGDH
jgi:hypothetical protein